MLHWIVAELTYSELSVFESYFSEILCTSSATLFKKNLSDPVTNGTFLALLDRKIVAKRKDKENDKEKRKEKPESDSVDAGKGESNPIQELVQERLVSSWDTEESINDPTDSCWSTISSKVSKSQSSTGSFFCSR